MAKDITKKIALECARDYGFKKVNFVTEIEGARIYEPYTPGEAYIGYARYIVVKDGEARMTDMDEGVELCFKIYGDIED